MDGSHVAGCQRHNGWSRALLATIACLNVIGCASFPAIYTPGPMVVEAPALAEGPSEVSTSLDVLTYNIEGLQWPARSGRSHDLVRIGRVLSGLRASGHAPDVVLFQEVFSGSAIRAVKDSGYPVIVGGPSRTRASRDSIEGRKPGRARPTKGELGIRFTGSGLVIASRYPVMVTARDVYSRNACAGIDCLSNKGVMLIRIAIPGVPAPVEIANTHMNAQKASKVKVRRHLAAHGYQVEELALFLRRHHTPDAPRILAGDFNMRRSQDRFTTFAGQIPLDQVHRFCLEDRRCDVRTSWDGDAPWMDTQDLQFFASGRSVRIVPSRVEAMFDGSPGSPQLSDHDGLRVVYKLSWNR